MGRAPLAHKFEIFRYTPVLDPVPFFSSLVAWFAAGSLLQAGALRPARRFLTISLALIPAQLFILDWQPGLR